MHVRVELGIDNRIAKGSHHQPIVDGVGYDNHSSSVSAWSLAAPHHTNGVDATAARTNAITMPLPPIGSHVPTHEAAADTSLLAPELFALPPASSPQETKTPQEKVWTQRSNAVFPSTNATDEPQQNEWRVLRTSPVVHHRQSPELRQLIASKPHTSSSLPTPVPTPVSSPMIRSQNSAFVPQQTGKDLKLWHPEVRLAPPSAGSLGAPSSGATVAPVSLRQNSQWFRGPPLVSRWTQRFEKSASDSDTATAVKPVDSTTMATPSFLLKTDGTVCSVHNCAAGVSMGETPIDRKDASTTRNEKPEGSNNDMDPHGAGFVMSPVTFSTDDDNAPRLETQEGQNAGVDLYVPNLFNNVTAEDLAKFFQPYEPFVSVRIRGRPDASTKFGFVTMSNLETAARAVYELGTQGLEVRFARPARL